MEPGRAAELRKLKQKAFPWFTVVLVAGALISQLLVIIGAYRTASALEDTGASVGGWSSVGNGVGIALEKEMHVVLDNISAQLIDVLVDASHAVGTMDLLLNAVGLKADNAIDHFDQLNGSRSQLPRQGPGESFQGSTERTSRDIVTAGNSTGFNFTSLLDTVVDAVHLTLVVGAAELNLLLRNLWEKLRPIFEKVGALLIRFGERAQAGVNTFTAALDRVQKIFDQILRDLSGAAENEQQMLDQTFNLFDTSNTGFVTLENLQSVSELYSITALSGELASVLVDRYDEDGDGQLTKEELGLLMHDSAIPDAMPVVLRKYANALARSAGRVANARMRDEIAEAVVQYFHVVVAKNQTKVQWVSDRLGNGSLPLAFTADVMAELCFQAKVDTGEKFTTADVGAVVIGELSRLHPEYTTRALNLLSNSSFWIAEGLQVADQSACLSLITKWVSNGLDGVLIQTEAALLYDRARELAKEQRPGHAQLHLVAQLDRERQEQEAGARASSGPSMAESLRLQLLGSTGPVDVALETMVKQTINAGQPAADETLEFARFLSWNATRNAAMYQQLCFKYSSQSSSQMDSFAALIRGAVSSVQSFLEVMMEYSTPDGIARLEDMFFQFEEKAVDDVIKAVESWLRSKYRTPGLSQEERDALPQQTKAGEGTEVDVQRADAFSLFEDLYESKLQQEFFPQTLFNAVSGAWRIVYKVLRTLCHVIPTARNMLLFAKREVFEVAMGMNSVFETFQASAPPLFGRIAHFWRITWLVYFFCLVPLSVFSVYYSAWAGGYFGGPSPILVDEELPRPKALRAKFWVCWNSSTLCMKKYHDTQLCFWSTLLLVQIAVLIVFVISFALCLLALCKGALLISCRHVYILNDPQVCEGGLSSMETFLNTFLFHHTNLDIHDVDILSTCVEQNLLTCRLIAHKMATSTILTTIFSFLGTLFSLQLLIDSAVQHEHARFRRMLNAMKEDVKEDSEGGESSAAVSAAIGKLGSSV